MKYHKFEVFQPPSYMSSYFFNFCVAIYILGLICTPVQATPFESKIGERGWLTHPDIDSKSPPVVLHFRRVFELKSEIDSFPVKVSADNKFILFVNGKRVLSGPSTTDMAHWRYSSIDLAPYLRSGENSLAATVWNYVKPTADLTENATNEQRHQAWVNEMMTQTGRFSQQFSAAGFWLEGEGAATAIDTAKKGWETVIDSGRSAQAGPSQVGIDLYYVASAPEIIDTREAIDMRHFTNPKEIDWVQAVPAPIAARTLTRDPLPSQRFALVPSGEIVRMSLKTNTQFPSGPLVIPAHSKETILIRRDAMVAAYPELLISQGNHAQIRMTYGEAMYDESLRKGDRKAFEGRQILGIQDEIIADGKDRAVMPLWWRVWHFLEIQVETADEPLTLEGMNTWETGYPFEQLGYFDSSDPELDRIWNIGWRTALVDAHDTYMDSAYWEQLQYVGDTRLQMLISYAVSGDSKLAEQAIQAFAGSNVDNGLIEGAWPSRGTNSIAPFSLLWIGMLHDWWTEQPDTGVVTSNLQRMREVLNWFEKWRAPSGLLRKNPQWNFVDWVGQTAGDRTQFPSYGVEQESCLTSIHLLGAFQQAAELEIALGDPKVGAANQVQAEKLRVALQKKCYSLERKLYADNPDKDIFSQQMNALAVLYDVMHGNDARDLLLRIVDIDSGIDAPDGMYTSSYYFAWYLVRAFEHAGLSERYVDLLKTWRKLLALNYTTWPEERGKTRSDTHAWSAHPTADLLRIVAGIGPGAAGYSSLRVAPSLGDLKSLDAAAMTPQGLVSVSYRVNDSLLSVTITKPAGLPGWFELNGHKYALKSLETNLILPMSTKK